MPAARPYDASSRREGAARNRAAVLAACRELLFRDGYHRMTVRSVAEHAGVSPETIYQSLYVQSRGALRRDLTRCLRTGRARTVGGSTLLLPRCRCQA